RPVVACLMDVGTGGAYYLATAADRIFAHPATVTGGVGVIINLYNLVDTMQQFNVRYQPIKAGPNIDMGSVTGALTPEANTPMQAGLVPASIPGLDRSRLPTFLFLWQPEPTMEKLTGR